MSPDPASPFARTAAANYWLLDQPLDPGRIGNLPGRVDLVVIGSGYTGLSAALEATRGGMSVLVVEAGDLGAGCSSRNGGQVSTSIKPDLGKLERLHGRARAEAIRAEGRGALDHLQSFIETEGIDAGWVRSGRFYAAHSPRQFEGLKRVAEAAERNGETRHIIVERGRQRDEIGSDFYHGGLVTPDFGHVQPAKLHAGLLAKVRQAGVTLAGHCPAQAIERDGAGFRTTTPSGTIASRHVLIATNGYSGPLSPWHRRRVIPIGSYILATEKLGAERARALIPNNRTIVDTRRVVVYYRLSPDGERMIFGGRAALFEADPLRCLPKLYRMMTDIYPDLDGVKVSHTWHGTVAYTFDTLPHLGTHEGVHYAMGYCGSGVSLSLWFGRKIARQILGRADGASALDGLAFPTRPLYGGTPWFLAPAVMSYRFLDRYLS